MKNPLSKLSQQTKAITEWLILISLAITAVAMLILVLADHSQFTDAAQSFAIILLALGKLPLKEK